MSRYLTSLSDPAARAPLFCIVVLVLCAVLQLGLATAPDLGAVPSPTARVTVAPSPTVARTYIPPSILAHPVFAPRMTAAAASGPVQPLGGASIAGVVTIGRTRYAIVRRADGKVGHMRIGGGIAGWRIAALDGTGATLIRGSERLQLPYGAATPPPAAAATASEEDPQ